jgi:hypothetical protein
MSLRGARVPLAYDQLDPSVAIDVVDDMPLAHDRFDPSIAIDCRVNAAVVGTHDGHRRPASMQNAPMCDRSRSS